MLKFKTLVCDDEKDKYDRLVEMLGDDIFEFEYISDFLELNRRLENDNYDVLFLDLYYTQEKAVNNQKYKIVSFEELQQMRAKITKRKKLIIYTKHTSDEIELLRKAALESIIDEWIDEQDLYEEGPKKDEAIIRINKIIGVHHREQTSLNCYHFADIHYGKQYKYLGEEICELLIEQIRDQMELIRSKETKLDIEMPKIIYISGDFTHVSSIEQIKKARGFLNDIVLMLEEYGVSSPVIALCLGNHDFNWDDSIVQENFIVSEQGHKKIEQRTDFPEDYVNKLKWFRFEKYFGDIINKYSTKSNYPHWIYY